MRPLYPAAFHFKPTSDENVRTPHGPDDRAPLAVRGGQLTAARADAPNFGRALPPEIAGEVRPVFPEAVADQVRIAGFAVAVILDRVGVSPAPSDRLAGPQHHVHGGVGSTFAVS